ncbi:MAG: HEAT repeat domain-containing protein [Actinomycetota bacterium]|nr:HEAT repeat domain-containing protein [Actinomycetota bacterium]
MDQGEDGPGRYTRLVAEMAIPHRRTDAYWQLLALGPVVVPVLHDGVSHSDAAVREGCVKLLDHFLTEETIPAIIAALDDEHPRVRLAAVHSLACDRCKKDACCPNDPDVLPLAIRLVTSDPDKHVRAMAGALLE